MRQSFTRKELYTFFIAFDQGNSNDFLHNHWWCKGPADMWTAIQTMLYRSYRLEFTNEQRSALLNTFYETNHFSENTINHFNESSLPKCNAQAKQLAQLHNQEQAVKKEKAKMAKQESKLWYQIADYMCNVGRKVRFGELQEHFSMKKTDLSRELDRFDKLAIREKMFKITKHEHGVYSACRVSQEWGIL